MERTNRATWALRLGFRQIKAMRNYVRGYEEEAPTGGWTAARGNGYTAESRMSGAAPGWRRRR